MNLKRAALAALFVACGAPALADVQSPKLVSGGVLENTNMEASKLNGLAPMEPDQAMAAKMVSSAVLANTNLAVAKLNAFAVLETSSAVPIVIRAPLTHW